jgi:hypothetical protein
MIKKLKKIVSATVCSCLIVVSTPACSKVSVSQAGVTDDPLINAGIDFISKASEDVLVKLIGSLTNTARENNIKTPAGINGGESRPVLVDIAISIFTVVVKYLIDEAIKTVNKFISGDQTKLSSTITKSEEVTPMSGNTATEPLQIANKDNCQENCL